MTSDRNLVPQFIFEKLFQNRAEGSFDGVVLFVDVSGFTQLTGKLMEHGKVGAEVLAEILQIILEPLVGTVYKRGGFVASFAGDAFTALFPSRDAETYIRALETVWQFQNHMQQNARQETTYGSFVFSVKASVAAGQVFWHIWPDQLDSDAELIQQRRVFAFTGTGIDVCMKGEALADSGQTVVSNSIVAALSDEPTALLIAESVPDDSEYTFLLEFEQRSGHNQVVASVDSPAPEYRLAYDFFPQELHQFPLQGEFRDVVTLFINMRNAPGEEPNFVKTFLALIHQYGGYLCRIDQKSATDRGGTALLFWGAPVSHENDVERALSFVQDLQNQTTMELRAGLTYQTAYAGFIGSTLREEYTCYSAHVNLAVRQMSKAAWGEVWVDEEIVGRAERTFNLSPLGAFQLKGFEELRTVYLLGRRLQVTPEQFYRHPLVGRKEELEQLWHSIRPLLSGGFGGIVIIEGEAGIGKSHLVHEFQMQTEVHNHNPMLWCLCQADEVLGRPLNPFRYWLTNYFNQVYSAAELTNQEAFHVKLNSVIANCPDEAAASELDRLQSFLATLVDLHWADSLYERVEPELRFENTVIAIKTLIKAESLHQPVVLHLEDAQYLDAESTMLIEQLTHNVESTPLLLLVSMRLKNEFDAQDPGNWLPQDVHSLRIVIEALGNDDVTSLAANVLGRPPGEKMRDLLKERSAGNPFYAEQILLYMRENQLIEIVNEWAEPRMAQHGEEEPLSLPPTARALLTARLDQLSTPVRTVVQTAAVLGREFDTSVLFLMLDDDPSINDKMLIADRAAIWTAMTKVRYLFRHGLLRDAAYDMQLRMQLRQKHQAAAEAIRRRYSEDLVSQYPALAYHYDNAQKIDEAHHWYGLAGEEAIEQYANTEAIRYFDRALELVPNEERETQFSLLLNREKALNWLGRRDEQLEDIERLLAIAEQLDDKTVRAQAQLRRAEIARVTGDYATARQHIEETINSAKELDDQVIQAEAYALQSRVLLNTDAYQSARKVLSQCLALARQLERSDLEAQALYDTGRSFDYQDQFEEAKRFFDQAQPLYHEIGERKGEINCMLMYGTVEAKQGNYENARDYLRQALIVCRESGWRYGEVYLLGNLATTLLQMGDLANAEEMHRQALAMCREVNDREGESISLDTLGLIHHFRGHYTQAVGLFEQALQLSKQIGYRGGEAFALSHLGYTLIELNKLDAAETCFDSALQTRSSIDTDSGAALDNIAGIALVELRQGNPDDSMNHVEFVLDWIAHHGIERIEYPINVYQICYQVLRTVGHVERAAKVLNEGYQHLQNLASTIQDIDQRSQFIESIPFNQKLFEAWQREHSDN